MGNKNTKHIQFTCCSVLGLVSVVSSNSQPQSKSEHPYISKQTRDKITNMEYILLDDGLIINVISINH